MSWLLKQLNKLPQPYRLASGLALIVLFLVIFFWIFGSIRACGYDKARKEYEERSEAWQRDRAILEGQIAERDKQIEQLKAKEAAIIAADQAGKKLDDAIAQKIDDVTKAAADEAARTDLPDDCWNRGDRTCAKLGSLKPPIVIDCDAYKRKICAR